MKIIVTSESTGNFKSVSDITWPIVQEYCDRHSYEFRPKMVVESERGPVWERVRSLQDALKDADWAVHLDADVLITNMLVPVTEFIEDEKSVVISKATREDGSRMFNDGFFMVKSDFKAQSILNRAWGMHDPDRGIHCAQDAMWHIFRHDYYQSLYFSVQPQKRFNSMLFAEKYGMPNTQGQWTAGDFLLHCPGMNTEDRVSTLTKYSEYIMR